MGQQQDQLTVVSATQVIIGLSSVIRLSPTSYQSADCFKVIAGGGTLEVVPVPLALSGSSCIGWGRGYPLGLSEVVALGSPAVFYLAASGATMTIAIMVGYTNGATITV